MNATRFAMPLLVAALAGCEAADVLMPSDNAVLTVGPDTFSVTASDLDSTVAARVALVQAENYCAARGKEMFAIRINDDSRLGQIGRRPVATVTFKCLTKDEFEQARQMEEHPPAVPREGSSK